MIITASRRIIDLNLGEITGWIVIDFSIMGLSWGGIRVGPDVTRAETEILARMISLKSALAGIPIGGAKVGIAADPNTSDKEQLIRLLARNLRSLILGGYYIPGSDMGFGEEDVQKLYKMLNISPSFTLHRGGKYLSHTGLAVAESLYTSIKIITDLEKTDVGDKVVLQGFGNMGSAAAYLLSKKGYRLMAISNKDLTIASPDGLDVDYLLELRKIYGDDCLRSYARRSPYVKLLPPESVFDIEADIHIPGARPLAIKRKPPCKLIAPLANYPVSLSTARRLESSGVWVIPDIISTAGGAIGSALSIIGRPFEEDMADIEAITCQNLVLVITGAVRRGSTLLEEAYRLAWHRLNLLRRSGPLGLTEYMGHWVKAGRMQLLSRVIGILANFHNLAGHRVGGQKDQVETLQHGCLPIHVAFPDVMARPMGGSVSYYR